MMIKSELLYGLLLSGIGLVGCINDTALSSNTDSTKTPTVKSGYQDPKYLESIGHENGPLRKSSSMQALSAADQAYYRDTYLTNAIATPFTDRSTTALTNITVGIWLPTTAVQTSYDFVQTESDFREWKRNTVSASARLNYGATTTNANFENATSGMITSTVSSVTMLVSRFVWGPEIGIDAATLKPDAYNKLVNNNLSAFKGIYGDGVAKYVKLGGYYIASYTWEKKASSNISISEMKAALSLKYKSLGNAQLTVTEQSTLSSASSKVTETGRFRTSMPGLDTIQIINTAASFAAIDAQFNDYYNKAMNRVAGYNFADMFDNWYPYSSIALTNPQNNIYTIGQDFKDPQALYAQEGLLQRDFEVGANGTIILPWNSYSYATSYELYYQKKDEVLMKKIPNNGSTTINVANELSAIYPSLGGVTFKIYPIYTGSNKVLKGIPANFYMDANRGSTLLPKDGLWPNEYLLSNNGSYIFTMQTDGNLVGKGAGSNAIIYLGGHYARLYQTTPSGRGGSYFRFQSDGNIVVYGKSGTVYSRKAALVPINTFNGTFVMQDDANIVEYDENYVPKWNLWGNGM